MLDPNWPSPTGRLLRVGEGAACYAAYYGGNLLVSMQDTAGSSFPTEHD